MPKKKTKAAALVTASGARKLATVTVHAAYDGHGIDKVSRVIDSVAVMTERRQIDSRQRRAADDYRDCYDTLAGAGGGSLDFDRVHTGAAGGAPPGPPALLAAERLADARSVLGKADCARVAAIAGEGLTIQAAAARFLRAGGER